MEEEEAAKTLLKPKNHTWKQKLKTGHYAKGEKKLPLLSRAGKQPSRKICLEIPLHQGQRRVALEAQKIVTRRIFKKERCWERDRERQRWWEREREPRVDGSLKGFIFRSSIPHTQTARFSPLLTSSCAPFAERPCSVPPNFVSPSTPMV